MYTQFQRFVATLLLFSILLQSCGNPNWKMVEPVGPAASGKTSKPSEAKKRAPAKLIQVQGGSSEEVRDFDGEPKGEGSTESLATHSRAPANTSSAALAGAASCAQPTTLSRAVHGDGQLSTSPPTSTRSLVISASNVAQASRPSSGSKKPSPHNANKPPHVVLDKASLALRKGAPLARSRAISPVASARSTALPVKTLQPTPLAIIPTHKEEAIVLKSTAALIASPSAPMGPFALSSGREITFSQVEGGWTAVVKETWGTFSREESLPVICRGELSAALRNLEGQKAIRTQRRIHILETHQPPWAPRVVYVGSLAVRGGGNVGSGLKKVANGLKKVVRPIWGMASLPFNAIAYVFKDAIPPLPCRVTVLPKLDADDLCDSEVNNSREVAGEQVYFYKKMVIGGPGPVILITNIGF